jgi:hypothetical protein
MFFCFSILTFFPADKAALSLNQTTSGSGIPLRMTCSATGFPSTRAMSARGSSNDGAAENFVSLN